jgi:hypothetical protein
MSKTIFEVIKILSKKVLGYLLFYIDDPKKRKEAFLLLNKQAKEKPVSLAGQHRRQTLFDDVRAVV